MVDVGQSIAVIECVYYVLDSNYNVYMDIQQEINLGILDKLEGNDVTFAYGTQFKWIPAPEVDAAAVNALGDRTMTKSSEERRS